LIFADIIRLNLLTESRFKTKTEPRVMQALLTNIDELVFYAGRLEWVVPASQGTDLRC
jgi:hypothetical protein